jgi:RimJ/RimL family protein N-acetyltransferase
MPTYPKQVKLNDDTEVTVRKLVKSDLEPLAAFFKNLPDEERQFLKEDVTDRKVIERWINHIDYDLVLPIIGEDQGKIVADATLHVDKFGWFKHVGEIRCVVAQEFQRSGLFTMLLRELYDNAQERKLSQLEVQVIGEHKTAYQIFERLGFQKEAVIKDFAVDIKGEKHNLIIMINNLEDLWKKLDDMMYATDIFQIRE